MRMISTRAIWYLILVVACPAGAQKLAKIGEFTAFRETYNDTVQFVPGALVIVHNDIQDGKNHVYQYHSGRFVRVNAGLAADMVGWNSFNWESVDYKDQIDRSDFEDQAIRSFLPVGARVKAFAVIPGSIKSIVLVCYAMDPGHEWGSGNERDLYLLMLDRGPFAAETHYDKLADLRVEEESYFGGLFVYKQKQGTFVVLYSNSGGRTNSATVFMLHGLHLNDHIHARK
jgi:hypothetical protein